MVNQVVVQSKTLKQATLYGSRKGQALRVVLHFWSIHWRLYFGISILKGPYKKDRKTFYQGL